MDINYSELFPVNKFNKDWFIEDLIKLQGERISNNVVIYFSALGEDGSMAQINNIFSNPVDQKKINNIIYSFASFMNQSDFVIFKKILGIHGHIIEFINAIKNNPPNLEIVHYFIMVAKSPRHYNVTVIKWFWNHVMPLLKDEKIKEQFLENCTNSIYRWIMTQKRTSTNIIKSPTPYKKNTNKGGFSEWCHTRNL